MFKTTKALVLREVKYKETDKILTCLSSDEGKLTVSARGVMGKNSKIAAACQFLSFSDMTLYERQGKLYIKEAQTIEQFLGLRNELSALALGAYFAELLETLSDEDSPNPELLSLGLNALYLLSREQFSQEHIKAVFELRLMCLSGFEPALDGCDVCGAEPEAPAFSTLGGILLCEDCIKDGHGEILPLSGSMLSAMRHIVDSEPKKIFSFTIDSAQEHALSSLCESYVTAQLERRFPALDYWKSVR